MSGPIRKGLKEILRKDPSDIVILSSLRTPITRSYKGHLKDAYGAATAAGLRPVLDLTSHSPRTWQLSGGTGDASHPRPPIAVNPETPS